MDFKFIIGVFLISFTSIIGFSVYKDYGLHSDSLSIRSLGGRAGLYINDFTGNLILSQDRVNKYINQNLQPDSEFNESDIKTNYLESSIRYYGVSFELFLLAGEVIIGTKDLRSAFFIRNILTHLIFILVLTWFYTLLARVLKSPLSSVFICLLIYFSPRIFADSFYNSKDIPFLCAYLSAGISLYLFAENTNRKNAVLHGILTGIVVSVRIPGIFIFGATGLLLIFLSVYEKRTTRLRQLPLWGTVFLLSLFVSYPILWDAPIENFLNAFKEMSKYPFLGDVLYLGKLYKPENLPQTYFIRWFFSTNPPFVLLGLFFIPFSFFKYKVIEIDRINPKVLLFLISILLFLGPLSIILLLKSNLFDGWRHLFFIYPWVVICSWFGWSMSLEFLKNKLNFTSLKNFSKWAGAVVLLHLIWTNYQLHPYQNIYFNVFAEKPINKNFELDYWGLSYREGFEYVLRKNPNKNITVFVDRTQGEIAVNGLEDELRKRLKIQRVAEEADYFIDVPRAQINQKDKIRNFGFTEQSNIYKIERFGVNILSVYEF